MENNVKKNTKEDEAEITKIYELFKDRKFIQELWLDVMSDLRQKPSYVRLKNMVEKAIETSVNNYTTMPKNSTEKLEDKAIPLGIMAYTIDNLISRALKMKLKDEIISMIKTSLEDYKRMRHQANMDAKTKAVVMLEDIGKIIADSINDNYAELPASTSSPSKRRLAKKTSLNQPSAKRDNTPSSISKESSSLKNGSLNVTSSSVVNSKSRSPSKRLSSSSKKSNAISDHENSDVDIMNVSDEEDEQDNHSIRSVSSVHTSDLSSFEDDISISSEDENGTKVKKRVSLKLAEDLYSSGRLSDLHKMQRTQEWVSPGSSMTQINDSNQRSSTRMRKPNSKYSSDDVVCPIKLNLTQTDSHSSGKDEVSSTHSNEMQLSSSHSTSKNIQKKRRKSFKSTIRYRNSTQEKESPSESDSSLPSLSDLFQKDKQTDGKRRRPKKDKSLLEQTSNDEQKREETKVKRGRSKSSNEDSVNKKQCVLDNMLPNLEKKLLKGSESQQTAQNREKDIMPEKGETSTNNSMKQTTNEEPIQHSVESFSKFEEKLCLKDKKVNETTSPSKGTKSYDTSDLYKPRSDFRVFKSGRKSQAFTLFSN